jgi:hypothetical protein
VAPIAIRLADDWIASATEVTAFFAAGLAGVGGGGFGLEIAAGRGWDRGALVDATTTAGRDAVVGLV